MRTIVVKDLYALHTRRGWNQTEVAQACGISVPMYNRMECGRSNPSPATFAKLRQGLRTTAQRLREGEPCRREGQL